MSGNVPAWGKESALLRIPDLSLVTTLSPEWALEGATGQGVRVAVIDSGIDADHPQLGDCVDQQSCVDFSIDAEGKVAMTQGPHGDVFGHGTACAGIIHMLAPKASITSVRVLGPGLRGKAAAFHAGLQWAVENNFDVINLSLGASKRDWALAFHEVCDRAYFGNSFIVTAANNIRRVSFPSLFSAVASVACNTSDDPLRYHYNPNPPTEFLARGIDVEVPWIDGGTTVTTGNSFAAPHIAGFAALIKSKHPDLQPFLVKAALWACAANIRDVHEPIEAAERLAQHSAEAGRNTALLKTPQQHDLTEAVAVVEPTGDAGRRGELEGDARVVAVLPETGADPDTAAKQRTTLRGATAIDTELVQAQALLPSISLSTRIARGSWGSVFAGTGPAGEVAVRVVDESLISDPVVAQRFVASVRAAARLDSPHVLPIFDMFELDRRVLIVMPRCPETLAEQTVPVAVGDACVAALSLLTGLTSAHASGVLHGDLNARNALIDSTNRVVVSDAGLGASLRTIEQTARLNPADWLSLAPEQILGQATGTYTDTYAVAAVLYSLLSAGPLRAAGADFAALCASATDPASVAPLSTIAVADPAICGVVDHALAPDPAHRFASAQSFFDALLHAATAALGERFIRDSRFVLESAANA